MSALELVSNVKRELEQELKNVKSKLNVQEVENLRVHYLGRKGKITGLMDLIKSATPDEKRSLGKDINELRQFAETSLTELKSLAQESSLHQKIAQEKIDFTLPSESMNGSLHPVSLIRDEVIGIFKQMGFIVADGPEVDLDYFNFSALNIPLHHPARDMQDTFYLKGATQLFLRTHTSNVQIHTMKALRPPLRVLAPGRTYRVDNDPTHTPMFHQVEGFMVDENISMAHLKGVLTVWMQKLFGAHAKVRLRPSYFPFVEPGAEMDMSCLICNSDESKKSSCRVCKGTGWLEIGGCGMIHPNVFEAVGYDSETYSGFAFGFGLDRMAMLKYGLSDLRRFFDQSYEFLSQFPISTIRG